MIDDIIAVYSYFTYQKTKRGKDDIKSVERQKRCQEEINTIRKGKKKVVTS